MRKIFIACFAGIAGLFSAVAFGAPGEYWEITTKMEMPGMPFAMPATTQKLCIGKGDESDPRNSSKDKDCEMTDVKTSGNKTSWNFRCNRNGEEMTGSGEQTTSANSYQGTMRFAGKSKKRDMNMTQSYSGKRIGGACDTGEMAARSKEAVAKSKEQMDQMCDTSRLRSTSEWIDFSAFILPKDSPCQQDRKKNKEQLCSLVRRDAPNDADTYKALVEHFPKGEVAGACGLNMAATTKSVCKKINDKNYDTLSPYCPAEAKSWLEAKRKREEAQARSYTGRSYTSSEQSSSSSGSAGDSAAAAALEAAKKLKGRFGF